MSYVYFSNLDTKYLPTFKRELAMWSANINYFLVFAVQPTNLDLPLFCYNLLHNLFHVLFTSMYLAIKWSCDKSRKNHITQVHTLTMINHLINFLQIWIEEHKNPYWHLNCTNYRRRKTVHNEFFLPSQFYCRSTHCDV